MEVKKGLICYRCEEGPDLDGWTVRECLHCKEEVVMVINHIDICDECSIKLSKCKRCGNTV